MKRFYEKLKSNSGASIVFALLVFLLCVLAGTVALTAASANAGRYTHLEEEQRQYFSVASALALLQDELDKEIKDKPVTVKIECVETEKWWYEEVSTTPGAEPTYELKTADGGKKLILDPDPTIGTKINYYQYRLLEDNMPAKYQAEWNVIKTAIGSAVTDHFEGSYTVSLDTTGLSVPGSPTPVWADSLYPVAVTVKNGSDASGTGNYNLEMTLKTKNGGAYPLKVVWIGEVKTETETTVETTGDILTPPPAGGHDSEGTRTTTTTITCTLTWSKEDRTVTFE